MQQNPFKLELSRDENGSCANADLHSALCQRREDRRFLQYKTSVLCIPGYRERVLLYSLVQNVPGYIGIGFKGILL